MWQNRNRPFCELQKGDADARLHEKRDALRLAARKNVLGYHLHTLRHFFVSTLLHEGVDKNTVADLAGHGDTSFLERTYCHPQMQLKQEAAKRMSNSLFAAPNPKLLVS